MKRIAVHESPTHCSTFIMRVLFLLIIGALTAGAQSTLPAYRSRLLGVYDSRTGDPIEGVEITDAFSKTSALTTKTGTVTLVFLPEGGTLVQLRKVGYQPNTLFIAISPADTMPITTMLSPIVTTLPTVVTRDSAPHYISPGLRDFEERRRLGFGHFITEAELRKSDNQLMSDVIRRFPGLIVKCGTSECHAASFRLGSKHAFLGGDCPVDVYLDGAVSTVNNLKFMRVDEYAGIEFYGGGATIPVQYNKTGSSCGVLLLWTRER